MVHKDASHVKYRSGVQPSAGLENTRLAMEDKLHTVDESRRKLNFELAQLQRFHHLSQSGDQLSTAQQNYLVFLRDKFFVERYPTRRADELVGDLDLLLQFYNFALMEVKQEKRVEQESDTIAPEAHAGRVIDIVPEVFSEDHALIAGSGDHLLKGLGRIGQQVRQNWKNPTVPTKDIIPPTTEFN